MRLPNADLFLLLSDRCLTLLHFLGLKVALACNLLLLRDVQKVLAQLVLFLLDRACANIEVLDILRSGLACGFLEINAPDSLHLADDAIEACPVDFFIAQIEVKRLGQDTIAILFALNALAKQLERSYLVILFRPIAIL